MLLMCDELERKDQPPLALSWLDKELALFVAWHCSVEIQPDSPVW